MRRHILNTDFMLFLLGGGFTVASALLSGYFGWLRAEGAVWWVQYASSVMCGGIAIALAMWVTRRERLRYVGTRNAAFRRATVAVWMFAVANLATDFMATSALLNLTSTSAKNTNTVAINTRKTLASIELRISELTHDAKGNKITLRPPAAYRSQIDAKQEEMRQEERRGCPSPPCRGPEYLKDKEHIAHLQTLLASAEELDELRARLPAAKAAVAENGLKADAGSQPVDSVTKLWSGSLKISEVESEWGQIIFILFITSVFSYGIMSIGAEQGRRLGPLPDYRAFDFEFEDEEPKRAKNRWLEAPEGYDPIPLKSETLPSRPVNSTSTNVFIKSNGHDTDAIRALQQEIADALGQDFEALTRKVSA